MIYVKTPQGQQAFKERHSSLTPKLRMAFLMVDGHRHRSDIVTATTGIDSAGVSRDDLEVLAALGYIEPINTALQKTPPLAQHQTKTLTAEQETVVFMAASQRMTALTARLGLVNGFKLNLAIEAAKNLDDLQALLPQLEAVQGATDELTALANLLNHH